MRCYSLIVHQCSVPVLLRQILYNAGSVSISGVSAICLFCFCCVKRILSRDAAFKFYLRDSPTVEQHILLRRSNASVIQRCCIVTP